MKPVPHQKRPVLLDVAQAAGCSIAVASRALSANEAQHRTVSAAMQSKVVEAAKRVGYLSERARSRRRPLTLLGLLVPPYTPSLMLDLITAVMEEANLLRAPVRVYSEVTVDSLRRFAEEVKQDRHKAGLIAYLPHEDADGEYRRRLLALQDQNCPVVLLQSYLPTESPFVSLQVDNYRGGWLAGEHLKRLDCREYWVFGSTARYRRNRITGFIDAISTQGSAANVHCHFIERADHNGGKAITPLLETLWGRRPNLTPDHPLGIFLDTDYMAPAIYSYLLRRQVVIGREVKVVGFDGSSLAHLLNPRLTTVAQPFGEMGHLAMRKLIRLAQGNPESSQLLQPVLLPGESG
jgi:LacI family transcriptional regulator